MPSDARVARASWFWRLGCRGDLKRVQNWTPPKTPPTACGKEWHCIEVPSLGLFKGAGFVRGQRIADAEKYIFGGPQVASTSISLWLSTWRVDLGALVTVHAASTPDAGIQTTCQASPTLYVASKTANFSSLSRKAKPIIA